jgi:hypothetical protein
MGKKMLLAMAGIAFTIGVVLFFSWSVDKNNTVAKYDCRMLIGGWHPDVPVAVQEACRKRSNK